MTTYPRDFLPILEYIRRHGAYMEQDTPSCNKISHFPDRPGHGHLARAQLRRQHSSNPRQSLNCQQFQPQLKLCDKHAPKLSDQELQTIQHANELHEPNGAQAEEVDANTTQASFRCHLQATSTHKRQLSRRVQKRKAVPPLVPESTVVSKPSNYQGIAADFSSDEYQDSQRTNCASESTVWGLERNDENEENRSASHNAATEHQDLTAKEDPLERPNKAVNKDTNLLGDGEHQGSGTRRRKASPGELKSDGREPKTVKRVYLGSPYG
ncbi:hypothetical protein BJ508DRAFT_314546 [Ascobolus immersus RN42]|uniref:Uncharacterized protein n=1 Tax=Ascobolus immersus RN42 TaxID=1160509 RepID=A0A3N4HGK9_ASCIM|nr:hypothetical protein BJ508DRAFT_314546 [Ascobolus immersus RN42]